MCISLWCAMGAPCGLRSSRGAPVATWRSRRGRWVARRSTTVGGLRVAPPTLLNTQHSSLLYFDAGRFHHLVPPLGIAPDRLREFLRPRRHDLRALRSEAVL